MFFLTYWLIFIVVFIGTFLIILVVHQSSTSNKRKYQEELNLKAKNSIESANFKTTKTFYLNDYATYNKDNSCKKIIVVDNDNKKLCLIDYEKGNLLFVEFNEILNYELYENGSNKTIGGNIGGFWSGIFGAETNGMCKELKLIIRLKRYDTSHVCYEIISNTTFNMGLNKSDQAYKQCISTLQEVTSFLEVVKNENISDTKKDTSI